MQEGYVRNMAVLRGREGKKEGRKEGRKGHALLFKGPFCMFLLPSAGWLIP